MKAPLTMSAALLAALLVGAPAASALTLQTQKSQTDGANLSDPDSNPPINPRGPLNFQTEQGSSSGTTFHIGSSTLHIGVTGGPGAEPGGNQWFLDSPASRTVPSQMH
jgi:hypothetical protein